MALHHPYILQQIKTKMSKEEKCTCGCGTDIVIIDDMVFSDHTSKWMKKSEWDKMYKSKQR